MIRLLFLILAALSAVVHAHTLAWVAPTTLIDGTAITSQITGYKVYVKTGATYGLYGSTTGTSYTVTDGTYAVCATFSGGQTGLSDSVTFPRWQDEIATPVAGNTVTTSDSRSAIQAKVDALTAGDVLYLRGGTYSHTLTGANLIFLTIGVSGTSTDYITIRNYPGETPIIEGAGFTDNQASPPDAQYLIQITGNYVRLYGLKTTLSGECGISVLGNYAWIEECESYANFYTGIAPGTAGLTGRADVNNGTVKYCKTHHSRRGGGLALRPEVAKDYNMDGWTFSRNITYRNGFNDDELMNHFGGGNSDGTGANKYAHSDYQDGDLNGAVTGRYNRIQDFHVAENMIYFNADDGVDVSSGDGTIFKGNMAINNGPVGTMGYKQFGSHYETSVYIGNVALGQASSIFPSTTVYLVDSGATAIVAGNTVTGATSGASATVDSAVVFFNGNADQSWGDGQGAVMYLSGLTGAFTLGENVQVGGATRATVQSLGQFKGVDHRCNDSNASFPYGQNNEVGWTALFHNQPGSGANYGISTNTAPSRGGDYANNLSYYNKSTDQRTNFTLVTNHANNAGVVPGIRNTSYTFAMPTLSGSTIQEQWRNLYRATAAQIMASTGGNLYGAGTLDTDYYHTASADDATAPSDPEDNTKLQWFKFAKAGNTPDIGAVQYQYIWPPVISESGSVTAAGLTTGTLNITTLSIGP